MRAGRAGMINAMVNKRRKQREAEM